MAILADRNVVQKEAEKKIKCKSLYTELQRMLNMKCMIVPAITGATRRVRKGLKKNLEAITRKHSIDSLKKTAILGTSHIIRKVPQPETCSLSGGDHRWFKRSARRKRVVIRDNIIIIIRKKGPVTSDTIIIIIIINQLMSINVQAEKHVFLQIQFNSCLLTCRFNNQIANYTNGTYYRI